MRSLPRDRRACRNSRKGGRSIPGLPHRRCWPARPVGRHRARASGAPPSYYPVAVSAIPPSGQQFVLTSGDQRAVVTEVGAGLRAYTVGEREVVDGFPEDEMATIGRGQLLLPRPNRIADGQYEFAGRMHQTPISEPARHNALHGLTRWMNWTAAEQAEDRVVMSLVLHPQDGYPLTLRFDVDYRFSARRARQDRPPPRNNPRPAGRSLRRRAPSQLHGGHPDRSGAAEDAGADAA